jgi:hypothetical protein
MPPSSTFQPHSFPLQPHVVTPTAIAAIIFRLQDRAKNITGASYNIDGGLMALLPERS